MNIKSNTEWPGSVGIHCNAHKTQALKLSETLRWLVVKSERTDAHKCTRIISIFSLYTIVGYLALNATAKQFILKIIINTNNKRCKSYNRLPGTKWSLASACDYSVVLFNSCNDQKKKIGCNSAPPRTESGAGKSADVFFVCVCSERAWVRERVRWRMCARRNTLSHTHTCEHRGGENQIPSVHAFLLTVSTLQCPQRTSRSR